MRAPRGFLALALLLTFPASAGAQRTGWLAVTSSLDAYPFACGAAYKYAPLVIVPLDGRPSRVWSTDADGRLKLELARGEHEVILRDTLPSARGCLTWRVLVDIVPGETTALELNSANGSVVRPLPAWMTQPPHDTVVVTPAQLAPLRSSLVHVWAGPREGTGVLVEPAGTVLTPLWVVAEDSTPIVELSFTERVRAHVVARDVERGVAALRIPTSVVASRTPLDLERSTAPMPGDWLPVVWRGTGGTEAHAIARVVDTAGGVSVEGRSLHRMLGGLLLTKEGTPVGIVVADQASVCSTPVPNVLSLRDAAALARLLPQRLAVLPPLPDGGLPPWPEWRLGDSAINAIAAGSTLQKYQSAVNIPIGNFRVGLETAPLLATFQRALRSYEQRRVQAASAKATGAAARCFASLPSRDRMAPTSPAPMLLQLRVDGRIDPEAARQLYAGQLNPGRRMLTGDLASFTLYRNGEPVAPFAGGREERSRVFWLKAGRPDPDWADSVRVGPFPIDPALLAPLASRKPPDIPRWRQIRIGLDTAWADTVHVGLYTFDPAVLAPDANGAPPSLVLYLTDRRHPDTPSCSELDQHMLAMLWNDFAGVVPDQSFVRSDPKKKPVGKAPIAEEVCKMAARRGP